MSPTKDQFDSRLIKAWYAVEKNKIKRYDLRRLEDDIKIIFPYLVV